MFSIKYYLLTLSLLTFAKFEALTQTNHIIAVDETTSAVFYSTEQEKPPLITTQRAIAEHYGQFYKRLPADYNGYLIELIQSDRPLSRDHLIFQQFGNLFYDKLIKGGYSYGILAENFDSVAALQRYIENMIHHRAPQATVVEYKNGKRRQRAKDKNCCPGLSKL